MPSRSSPAAGSVATIPSSLSGKHILVTGGSRGVGAAACALFAKRGCSVVVGYVSNATAAAEVRQGLSTSHGQQHHTVQGDAGTAEVTCCA